ncbi:hypothetical protein ACIBEF_32100 [Micromonospora sp. NPDC050795]|uniref:hypothetical protein n=1 Tax=Micromonospora sp. NPDC050795 TaxID=3364282 RepID=UPI0037A7974D
MFNTLRLCPHPGVVRTYSSSCLRRDPPKGDPSVCGPDLVFLGRAPGHHIDRVFRGRVDLVHLAVAGGDRDSLDDPAGVGVPTELLAYGREFVQPRPYTLGDLAAA